MKGLGQVRPSPTAHNPKDAILRHPVLASEVNLSFTVGNSLPNIGHLLFGEFGKVTLRSPRRLADRSRPTFRHAIRHVVRLRSNKQMVGIHAPRMVTLVANAHARRRPFVKLVRNTMSKERFTCVRNAPVAVAVKNGCPSPAVVKTANFDAMIEMAPKATKLFNSAHFHESNAALFAGVFTTDWHNADNTASRFSEQAK